MIKEKLDKLFTQKTSNEDVQEIIDRGYVCANTKPNEILFIGINPSYTKDAKPESYFYNVSNAVGDYGKHYKPFDNLISNTKYKGEWSYIDLFYFRETDQKKLDLIIKNEIQFIVEQLRLTNEIIKQINPQIIVVANSKANNFFGVNKKGNKNIWYGLNFVFDTESGLYKVVGIDEDSIIDKSDYDFYKDKFFLFTSTLTYMNRFEKERLSWLIDRV